MTSSVPMPEAPVHENYQAMFWKDKIRASWKVLTVEAKSKPALVEDSANDFFRFGILATNLRHERGSERAGRFVAADLVEIVFFATALHERTELSIAFAACRTGQRHG